MKRGTARLHQLRRDKPIRRVDQNPLRIGSEWLGTVGALHAHLCRSRDHHSGIFKQEISRHQFLSALLQTNPIEHPVYMQQRYRLYPSR